MKLRHQNGDFFGTSGLNETFSKGDTTNWSFILYKITQIVNDTIPNYPIDESKERYDQVLLKKVKLALKEDKERMKALKLK